METVSYPGEVHLVVGGYHYYLDTDDLLEHPDSYFTHMLKDEWVKDKTAVITLDRNGKAFRHISYYLYSRENCIPIYDLDALLVLRTEADFYGLPDLLSLCDDRIKHVMASEASDGEEVGLICDCVRANEEKSTDALVEAMYIFRPPMVATSRLETYRSDSFHSQFKSLTALLKRSRVSTYYTVSSCKFAHKCVQASSRGFCSTTNLNVKNAFSSWPLTMPNKSFDVSVRNHQVFIYGQGGYCVNRVPTPIISGQFHGSFLYIFNSEHTGGRVTTKVNGEEVSIEKPGECMALLPGCSYTVEAVTSGHLVLFEFNVTLAESDDNGSCDDTSVIDVASDHRNAVAANDENSAGVEAQKNPLVWQVRDSYSTEITTERSAALTQAINTALQNYAGVVICLSTYYPAGHSTNTARRCETDPALLKSFDADLHAHLSTFYEVTVVTVAVNADGADEKDNADYEEEEAECNPFMATARVLDFPFDADMKLKVVAPMQRVSLDRGSGNIMLLTGFLCFARG